MTEVHTTQRQGYALEELTKTVESVVEDDLVRGVGSPAELLPGEGIGGRDQGGAVGAGYRIRELEPVSHVNVKRGRRYSR